MTNSIKKFLLIYLLLSITTAASLSALGNYFIDKNTVEKQFDAGLFQASYFIRALTNSSSARYVLQLQKNIDLIGTLRERNYPKKDKIPAALYHTQFKVWDASGNELIQTPGVPDIMFSTVIPNGYSTIRTGGHTWRIFKEGPIKGSDKTVLIADLYDIRDQLQHKMAWGNVLMLFWTFPFIGILIWLIVDKSLRSLERLTFEISKRRSTQLDLVENHQIPIEVRPLVDALNGLFLRLDDAFEKNKRFSGDAAHELRTPLAAVRAQVQVALHAVTEEDRTATLKNVILAVDRCTHVVQQLLTLSRLGPEATLNDIKQFDLTKLTTDMVIQLVPKAIDKDIDIELIQPDNPVYIHGNETSISILMRNLIDNAIRYTPEKGDVKVYVEKSKKHISFKVMDSGRGIPRELRSRVFERFYRVLGTKQQGSGLGLAIVQQIASLHHAQVSLASGINGKGLEVKITFSDKDLLREAKLLNHK